MSKSVPRFQTESDTENEEEETLSRISVQLKKEQGLTNNSNHFPFSPALSFF
jgi:hypothetical protein